jgi:YggT family protein
MFALANFFQALAMVIDWLITMLWWVIVIRALLSWVSPDPFNPIVRLIEGVSEPLLAPIRQMLPPWKIGLDISPIIALMFLYFMRVFLVQTLFGVAAHFR